MEKEITIRVVIPDGDFDLQTVTGDLIADVEALLEESYPDLNNYRLSIGVKDRLYLMRKLPDFPEGSD